MCEQFIRTEILYGKPAMEQLNKARIAVFGIGGVGGYTVEALVRSGVGAIDLIDNDDVCLSNLNRQIIATHKTLGMSKTDAAEERILDINPNCKVTKHKTFFTPQNSGEFDFSLYDYIVDAIDTVSGKIELVIKANEANIPIISSMGAGNKTNPALFEVADIYKTSVCPLARVMRNELKKRRVKKLKVVYSKEQPIKPYETEFSENEKQQNTGIKRRQTPGSTAFVPSVAGLIIAGEVINDLTKNCN